MKSLACAISSLIVVLGCCHVGFKQSAAAQQPGDPIHEAAHAVENFEIHPELDVNLFAAEPWLANPTNIDVDHLGRVWVCEVVNYRHFRNTDANLREAGDRILILEDTDGDAVADKETVFYQGRDIDSAHGICVLGDRAIVSANDRVFFLIDTDRDGVADKKEILFTGISGVQHDHGIHAFVFGPDGKIYFNFGNEGKQICDAQGQLLVDLSGRSVTTDKHPYTQGMVFRCNLDGSEFETLAWNFRNNWELCIDSFGAIWQSDNDDDGNRATRINYVIPFGDYGYTEQGTGGNWSWPRTNWEKTIPLRHWHQNDPGVIPNLLLTGAGSPTGILIYEGGALPAVFQNQIIHCDAGPSIVRAYPVAKQGAGYTAEIVNLIDGAKKNQWFRPSDVCVAPDGSLIVADWYDPGVGGHRMQDTERGRLFHVTRRGEAGKFSVPKFDFTTPVGAVDALKSPNQATRFLAWTALEKFGVAAKSDVEKLWHDENPRFRARGLWMLAHLELSQIELMNFLRQGLADDNPDIQATAVRVAVHLRKAIPMAEFLPLIDIDSASVEVRRELLIGLRQWSCDELPTHWTRLANNYDSGDRWYLEALGIAADGNWDKCLAEWLGVAANDRDTKLKTAAGRDIVWRSRGTVSAELLARIIADESTSVADLPRYFRAFDFLEPTPTKTALTQLAFNEFGFAPAKAQYVTTESVSRLNADELTADQKFKLKSMIEQSRDTRQFVSLVNKFSSSTHYVDLLTIAASGSDRQLAADAMGVLLEKEQMGIVHAAIVKADETTRVALCDSLVNSGKRPAAYILGGIAKRADLDRSLRTYAIKRLGEIGSGAGDMLWWIEQKEELDPVIMPAIQAAMHNSQREDIRKRANELFPLALSKGERPLPAIANLVQQTGDSIKGEALFSGIGTCAKCHLVNGKGIEVGPDLSEIGNKLTGEAMYESILFPSAGISHNYESWLVQTIDGELLTGVLLSETESEIQLKDDKGIKHVIPVSNVEAHRPQPLSLMPADLHKELSEQDLVDLVAYLQTLKTANGQPTAAKSGNGMK